MTDLDDFQRDTVNQTGNVLLDAGPGAGKTRTLAAKMEQVLSNGIDLSEILALSFSNQAKNEIVRRLPFMDKQVKTLHAFGNSLLKTHYGVISMSNVPDILDGQKLVILEYLIGGYPLYPKEMWKYLSEDIRDRINSIAAAINKFKSTPDSTLPPLYQEPYEVYEAYLKKNHLIDFNDMLLDAIEEIDRNPVAYKWIFLDEGHDTSMLQYELLKRIKTDHIWSVFSPHQMIYRWNGADERNREKFKADYSPEEAYLKNAYRSGPQVIKAIETLYKEDLIPLGPEGLVRVIHVPQAVGISYSPIMEDTAIDIAQNYDDSEILARTNKELIEVRMRKIPCNTLHGSKGTEHDTIVIISCGDGKIPHPRSTDLEEEQNLLYVGMSRAKRNLFLLYSDYPSPFIRRLRNGSKKI